MKVLIALCLLLVLPAQGAAPAKTRPPTPAEMASFEAWHKAAHPDAGPATLEVVRTGKQWTVTASVDAPIRRAGRLCRFERSAYQYDARGRLWLPGPGPRHFAWIERQPSCVLPAHLVEVDGVLPNAELTTLLAEHGALLLHSRLLMAGNTSCAPMRAFRLKLGAVRAHEGKAAGLVELAFVSDRATRATVILKKGRSGYDPWGVACSVDR